MTSRTCSNRLLCCATFNTWEGIMNKSSAKTCETRIQISLSGLCMVIKLYPFQLKRECNKILFDFKLGY